MPRRPLTPFVAAAVLALFPLILRAQDLPNVERGFNAERTFQVGDIDNVNLFNGNLVLTVPIGMEYPVGGGLSYRLTLVYNSNVWDHQSRVVQNVGELTQALPRRRSNAGLGWTLTLGRLLLPWTPGNDSPGHVYMGPDGADHNFYATLHTGDAEDPLDNPDDPFNQAVQYTRDGSYLRLLDRNQVEFPNGEVHQFDGQGRLVQIRRRFAGSWVNIEYLSVDPDTQELREVWRITDSQSRTHLIQFRNDLPEYSSAVSEIRLQAPGGNASYVFGYNTAAVPRGCDDNDPLTSALVDVPLLTGLTLPDGSTFSMPVADYITNPPSEKGACQSSGAIRGMTLPTLGRLEWVYQTYTFSNESSDKPPRQKVAGIAARTVKNAAGTALGQWSYTTSVSSIPVGLQTFLAEMVNTVTDPLGNQTKNYFSIYAAQNLTSAGWTAWEYGLPLTRNQPDATGNRFLSTQVLNPNGTLLRSSSLRYEMDERGPVSVADKNRNRRVASSRTVFHDDAGRFADVTYSDFDGLGHHRQATTGGNFGSGDVRTTKTMFNRNAGTYQLDANGVRLPGFSMIASSAPWVLETYDEIDVTEGTWCERSQACFNTATGFLLRTRQLQSPGAPAATDVVAAYTADSAGNVASEKHYGGDNGGLGTGSLCSATLPTPSYQIDHTYQSGTLATSKYFDAAAGTALPFFSVDRTIGATGLAVSSRDSAGIQTDYEYDNQGRLTWIKPAAGHGGWTEYQYNRALTASDLADVVIRQRANGSKSAAVLAQSQILYDALGRIWKESRRMPDGTFSVRETLYDGAGQRASVSEPGNLSKKTQFLEYDPFGRAARIRPPDGAAHDLTFNYTGISSVARTVPIATAQTNGVITETAATTTETYDRQGRLWKVTEPSGANGANVTTIYSYDAANRLRTVSTTAAGVTQPRTFTYDGRGFLTSETHPEKGATGGGTVSYGGHDARGHATTQVDGPNALTFAYDRAERLTSIRETGGQQRNLKTFTYANNNAANNWRLGKLLEASRFQYPVISGTPFTIEIKERYSYGGRDGRVSGRDTSAFVNGGAAETFTQGFEYDPLGQVRSIDYPVCTHPACVGGGAVFQDVPAGHPYKSEIEAIFAAGITGGCNPNPLRYCPDNSVTRAQMAVFLLLAKEGSSYTPPPCTSAPFLDVQCSYWAAAWIAELARRGVTGGCGNGNYCPENPVTEAQMAVFLLKTKEGLTYAPSACVTPTFNDVPCDHWAAAWVEEEARRGIRAGCGNGDFCPDSLVPRGEMAALLVRTFGIPVALSPATNREVVNTYTSGLLTRVGNYATSITYHPNRMINQVVHGNGPVDTQQNDPNHLRRPASIATTNGATTMWSTGTYTYDGAGNIAKMGTSWFTYDKVSRLISSTLFLGPTGGGTQVAQTYTFDPYGNLTAIGGSSGRTIPTSSANNRLSSATVAYDTAGNLTAWNGAIYEYDAFNQMQRMKSGSEDWLYFYTADDERIWSYNFPANLSRWTLRDLGSQVLREYTNNNGSWRLASDYIYRDGLLLAAETPAGPKHFHLDHLGTPRLITNSAGQQAAFHVYYPFGEEATAFNQDSERMKFTGHERDLASLAGAGDDLDYMHARVCSPVTGRFVSVDPSDSARRSQPQTWNKYAYGLNNPVRYIDKDGQVEREGQLAGVIVNRSSETIWIAGDVGNKTYVIPLEPGESSDSYFKDADAVVIDPGESTPKGAVVEPSVEGKQSGAFKIGASEVEVGDAGPLNLDISRGIGYVGSWALGRAGYLDSEEAQANGWVVPKDKEKAATDKEKLREKREEDKRKEGHRQKKRDGNSGHRPPST